MNANEKTSLEPARWKRAGDEGIRNLSHLVQRCFKRDGHHVRFNVVAAEALRATQADLDAQRDLIVRVAGYSDSLCALSAELEYEITEHESFS